MRKSVLMLFWTMLASFAFGDPISITVDQAVELALKNNLALQNDDFAVSIQKRLSDLSFNKLFPSLTAGVGTYSLNEPTASNVLIAVVPAAAPSTPAKLIYYTPNALNLTGSVTAQWTLTLSALESMAQTTIDYHNSQISRAQAEQQVATRVREAYFQLFVLDDSFKLTQNQFENAAERLRQVTISHSAGLATELDLMQAKIAQDSLKPVLQSYQQSRNQAMLAFEGLLDFEPGTTVQLEQKPSLPPLKTLPSATDLIQKFGSANLDVRAARGQSLSTHHALTLLDSSLWPALVVQWTADPLLNDPMHTNWLNDNNWIQQTGGLTIQLSWKLDAFLPGSTYWMNHGNLVDSQKKATNELTAARRNWETKVRNLVDALNGAQQNLDAWRDVAQSAVRAQELTESAYRAGTKTVLDANEAAISAESAQLNVLNAEFAVYSNRLELQDALAGTD